MLRRIGKAIAQGIYKGKVPREKDIRALGEVPKALGKVLRALGEVPRAVGKVLRAVGKVLWTLRGRRESLRALSA